MTRAFFASIFAAAMFVALPAGAGDAGEAAAAWGLLGTWSLDCTQPASRANAHLSFVRVGGKVVHRRDFGDVRDEFPVESARALKDGALEIVMDLGGAAQRRTIVFARIGEEKKRAMSNRGEKGDFTIRDGKFVGSGTAVPVQTRCALTN